MNKNELVRSIAEARGYIHVNDGEDDSINVYLKEYWERHAVDEFARIARRYNLHYENIRCKGIQIIHNFTVVHFHAEIPDVFEGNLYGSSKVRVGDRPCPFIGISVAVSNLIRSLVGNTEPYTSP